jgi:hypothetical protein
MDTPYEKLLAKLAGAEVKFIIVDGVAVALNGFVRTTEDVDILIESSAENVTRLINELRNFGEGHARKLIPADFSESEGAIRIIEDFPSTCLRSCEESVMPIWLVPRNLRESMMPMFAISTPKHSSR